MDVLVMQRVRKREKAYERTGQLSLFTDYMIAYMENPKASTKQLLELLPKFSKLQDIKSIFKLNYMLCILVASIEKLKEQFHL